MRGHKKGMKTTNKARRAANLTRNVAKLSDAQIDTLLAEIAAMSADAKDLEEQIPAKYKRIRAALRREKKARKNTATV